MSRRNSSARILARPRVRNLRKPKSFFSRAKAPHLDGAEKAQMDPPGRCNALGGFRAFVSKSPLETHLFGLFRVLGPATLAAAGTTGTTLTPVPGGADKLAVPYFRTFPAERELPALGTGEAVFLRVVGYILYPANLFLELFMFLLVVVCGLDKAGLAGGIQVSFLQQVVLILNSSDRPFVRFTFLQVVRSVFFLV